MEQKYALYLIPAVVIIGLGLYWFFRKRTVPTHYFHANATQLAKENSNYRQVLYTTKHSQLTLMAIPPEQEIPKEIHNVDQLLVIVEGAGQALIENTKADLTPESVLIIPADTEHTISNTGTTPLKLYTMYAPPEHPPGTIHKTKEDEPGH